MANKGRQTEGIFSGKQGSALGSASTANFKMFVSNQTHLVPLLKAGNYLMQKQRDQKGNIFGKLIPTCASHLPEGLFKHEKMHTNHIQ